MAGSTPRPPKNRGTVVPYDLTSQDRVIRGQMPTLDAINEQVASMLGIGLAGRTRVTIRVTSWPGLPAQVRGPDPMLAPPASVCVIRPGQGRQLRAAGARARAGRGDARRRPGRQAGARPTRRPRRDPPRVHQRGAQRAAPPLLILTDGMAAAWAPVLPFRPEMLASSPTRAWPSSRRRPRPPCSAPSSSTGRIKGRLQLAMPYTAIESAKKTLVAARAAAPTPTSASPQPGRRDRAGQRRAPGLLGKTRLPSASMLELQAGDVLTLDTGEGNPLPVFVQGRDKFTGQPTVSGGSMAIQIDRGPLEDIRRPFQQEALSTSRSPQPDGASPWNRSTPKPRSLDPPARPAARRAPRRHRRAGRNRMTIQDLLALSPGSVLELDKIAGEPLDIVVNDRLIARGEAVVINDKFGIRITDIISKAERIARLR